MQKFEQKKFAVEFLYLAVFSTVTVMLWIGFEVFRALTTPADVPQVSRAELIPLSAEVNPRGLEIVQESLAQNQETAFIILTMYREEEYFNHALDSGVKGYLLKENASDELLNCIKSVVEGHHYVSPVLSEYLIKRTTQTQLSPTNSLLSKLTQMEVRILRLIAENKTSREIADELFISHRTVQNHRTNICCKLDLKGHNRLLQFALENKGKF